MDVYDRKGHIVVKGKASYKDGILTIELRKSKAAISKEADIRIE
jgi:HSP20 family molecular chaperone IbpA